MSAPRADPETEAWFARARAHPIEKLYIDRKFKFAGGTRNEPKGACPNCGGRDRFGLNITKQVFTCHSCGLKGQGAIDFLIKIGEAKTPKDAAMILEGATPADKPNGHTGNGATRPTIIAEEGRWEYFDAEGKPYMGVRRFRMSDGTKSYPQLHLDGNRWEWGKPKGPKIPYRLPQLLDSDRSEPIYICEGEKCADAVAKLGLFATSASEGAGKWTTDLNEHFRDRIVHILPDNDGPGIKHAELVARNLTGIAREVRIVPLPVAASEDVFDWIARGGTADELGRLGDQAPTWRPAAGVEQGPDGLRETPGAPLTFDPPPYPFPDPAKIPKRQWLYGNHYMRGVVSGTLGAPGRLKSTTLLTEFVGMSAGRNLITGELLAAGPLHAAYLNGEETQDEIDRRVAGIMQRYKLSPEDCAGRLWAISTRDAPIRFAVMGPNGHAILAREILDAVVAWCEARSIDVFGIDPLVSFHSARENDPADMDLLYKEGFGRIAGKERRAVDLAIHPRKPSQGEINTSITDLRGSGAQEAALRIGRVFNFMTTAEAQQLGVTEDDRRLHIRIDGGKGGPAPLAKATWLKIETEDLPNGDTVAIATRWYPPQVFADLADASLNAALTEIDKGLSNGQRYSNGSTAVKRAAWSIVQKHCPNKNEAQCRQIVNTWVRTGLLYLKEYDDPIERKKRNGLHVNDAKRPGTTI